ncbi:mRNA-decapping enzyme subunit 2 [Microbotryomycetes sp. JL201]|nr:mRNA-decapping enzyme subunit 2 [Microbotryomycetes sp. JL201]
MSSPLKEEDVWQYPRPPALEPVSQRLRVIWIAPDGVETTIADTLSAYRVLETSHPPTYYLSPEDCKTEFFTASMKSSFCEWKGRASYFDFHPPNQPDATVPARVWSYPNPTKGTKFGPIANYLSFYADPGTDETKLGTWKCFVGDEQVRSQDGSFYGGWVTSNLKGRMKGGPGTWGW